MFLSEILLRKKYLDSKLETINKYIALVSCNSTEKTSELLTNAITYKFELLSKIRSHSILIDKLNKETYITVSNVELSISEALYLLNTLEKKINTFTDLIESDASVNTDVFLLFDKNDTLFEEYQRIYLTVLNSDLQTKWEG